MPSAGTSTLPTDLSADVDLVEVEVELDVVQYRQTPEGKEVARWLKNQFEKCKTLRSKEEKQWNFNLAMYSGNQWAERSRNPNGWTADLYTPLPTKGKERRTINRIKSVCRTEMSKFLSRRPGATVIPSTSEDEDQLAAEAAEQIWTAVADRRHLDHELVDAIFWMVVTGNGFIKTYWDDTKYDTDSQMMGDVCYGSVDPYKLFFPDLKVKDLEGQPYMFHAYAMPTERLKLSYEAELEGIDLRPTCKESDTILESSFANPRSTDEKEFDSNMVYELWIKPGVYKGLREGGRIVMVEDTMVAADIKGMPYTHGEFPVAHFKHILTGRFYGSSVIEELADPQRTFNRLRSQIADSIYKMGKPQLTAAKGSISAARMTNEVGLVVEYKLGHQPPQPLPLQQLPTHIMDEVQMVLTDIEDLSGQHQVTKGTVPPGVTAAAAISFLQEADDSYLFTSYQNVEEAYEHVAKQTLELVKEYWDVPRQVKVAGSDLAFSVRVLSGADIHNATDIRIEKGSSLPQSKAAKQALLMDMMTNGFVPVEEGMKLMEIGGAQPYLDQIQTDRRQAARENVQFKMITMEDHMMFDNTWNEKIQEIQMATGQDEIVDPQTGQPIGKPPIIAVNDFDNHAVHIEEHNRFRRSQSYAMLLPETKTALEQHVEMHKTQMANQAIQNMLSQIPTDGSVPGVSGVVEPGSAVPEGGQEVTPPEPGSGLPGSEPTEEAAENG